MTNGPDGGPIRVRREPPPFIPVSVQHVEPVTGWLRRVRLAGEGLRTMDRAGVAASVRVLLPGSGGLVMPVWTGNEFLLEDGTRPVIRTLTPRNQRGSEIDLEIVLHAEGAASGWARRATVGDAVAISGPGRGSEPDAGGGHYLLAGDETAVPAVTHLLETMPPTELLEVLVETDHPDDPAPFPRRNGASITWLARPGGLAPGSALVDAITRHPLPAGIRIWAAGEAAAMQRIRRELTDRDVPRSQTTIRGYWKHGKVAGGTPG